MYKKKILLICSSSQTVLSFRRGLIEALQLANFDVSILVFDSKYKESIQNLGVSLNIIEEDNRSLNPFKTLSLKKRIGEIIKKEAPDLVFTFMLKPNIFGVLAAKKGGVKHIFSMVEGVGDVYTRKGIKWWIIRNIVTLLYRRSLNFADIVFFLNNDNKNEFIERGIIKEEKAMTIPGIGVDLKRFQYTPINNYQNVLMVARLLKTKGVYEYCEAARILKLKYPNARFQLLGPECEIKASDLRCYIENKDIEYIPQTSDVRPYLRNSGIYVLPSYKEGLSMSVIEAEAIGRAIVTSNTTGCVDSIAPNVNGLLVEVGNAKDLAEKIRVFLDDKEKTKQFGEASRKLAEDKFDQQKINKRIISIIKDTLLKREEVISDLDNIS